MGRKKMTEEEKAVKAAMEQANHTKKLLERDLRDLREAYNPEPTILYKVGERVRRGAVTQSIVSEVLDGGKIYKLDEVFTENNYGRQYTRNQVSYAAWHDILPFREKEENDTIPIFLQDDDIRVNFCQQTVDSLLLKVYSKSAGVDFNPPYQRGLVWTLEQKQLLIDSIFQNIEIGKFAFVQRDYGTPGPYYEILDGKQRLSTLCEFYEGRFRYKGLLYRELNWRDRFHFDSYSVSVGTASGLTQEQKYRHFLKLNVAGVLQDESHIQMVRDLLAKELALK